MVEDGELSGFEACSPNVLEQSLGESGQMIFHYSLSEANMDPKVFLSLPPQRAQSHFCESESVFVLCPSKAVKFICIYS